MVVLDDYRVYCSANRAFPVFTIFKPHFSDVFAAAGNFNTDDCSVVKDIHPVIVIVVFVLVVHDYITPKILFK